MELIRLSPLRIRVTLQAIAIWRDGVSKRDNLPDEEGRAAVPDKSTELEFTWSEPAKQEGSRNKSNYV